MPSPTLVSNNSSPDKVPESGTPVTAESPLELKKAEDFTSTTKDVDPSVSLGENNVDLCPEEEVLEGDWMRPQVDIKEVEVKTGEEDEDCFWRHRAKLYRWAKDSGEWKERGLGEAKLLQHKVNRKIRFLLRQEKTLKIVANHYVVKHGSFCSLTPNVGSDKIWVWSVPDFSDNEPKTEQFGLKFGQVEAATEFKSKFEEAAKLNQDFFSDILEKMKEKETVPAEKQ